MSSCKSTAASWPQVVSRRGEALAISLRWSGSMQSIPRDFGCSLKGTEKGHVEPRFMYKE